MRLQRIHGIGLVTGLGVGFAWSQGWIASAGLLIGSGGPLAWPVLLGLVAIALAGVTILRWLPAGQRGGFATDGLATTWATGHVIGLVLVELLGLVLAPEEGALPWTVALLAICLGLARWIARPAPMAPGYPLPSSADALGRNLPVIAFAVSGVLLILAMRSTPAGDLPARLELAPLGTPTATTQLLARVAPGDAAVGVCRIVGASSWLALIVLIVHALRDARRTVTGARLTAALVALTPLPLFAAWIGGSSVQATLFFGAGCAALVPWFRRADRQALAFALIAFLGSALVGHPTLALGGLLAVIVATPRTALRFAVQALVVLLVLAGAFVLVGDAPTVVAGEGPAPVPADVVRAAAIADYGLAWVLFIAAMVATAVLRSTPAESNATATIAAPRRETAALGVALVVAALGEMTGAGATAKATLLLLFPVAALVAGLVLLPAERAQSPRHSLGFRR